jgi:hypothetical protein
MRTGNVRFNYHDYLLLPEDKRYEIIDGELYAVPAPDTSAGSFRGSDRLSSPLLPELSLSIADLFEKV